MPVDRSRNSHAYENLVEHLFLADLLRHMWYDEDEVVEIAKAQVDSWGYDLVLSARETTRYVQLKTSVPADVNELLARRSGGCVVAVLPRQNGDQLFYRVWEVPADVSQLRPAKSTVYKRGSAKRQDRSGHRQIPASLFSRPLDISSLCDVLFPRRDH